MTTLNKLNRAIESLKRIITKTSDGSNKQKEKVALCLTITDLLCKSNEKNVLLTSTITSLIQLLEEADSNTRLIIDECLNKIIRASIDNSNYVAKILIALLKILGKNTNERCLKATLWRFSELAHFIRPQQGKVYVQTLVPIIVKIAGKKEETIIETVADSLPNILKHIGLFTTDNDIKILLKAFLRNLYSDSIEIQRAAASSIVVVCKYSRKPSQFFVQALTTLLDLLHSSQKLNPEDRTFKQGCLCCIRQILPYIISCNKQHAKEQEEHCLDILLSIYELSLQYAKFQDHNVVISALETLCQLLQEASLLIVKKLTIVGGLMRCTIAKNDIHGSTLSIEGQSDIISISSTIAQTEDGIFTDIVSGNKMTLFSHDDSCSEYNSEQIQTRTEKWVEDQSSKDSDSISSSLLNINVSHFANSDDEDTRSEIDVSLSSCFRAFSLDNIQQMSCEGESLMRNSDKHKSESVKSISEVSAAIMMHTFLMELDIGSIFDENEIPLNYCARFLVSAFLLGDTTSKKGRVSVLSLSLNCFAQLLRIYPAAAFISVERSGNIYEGYSNLLEVVLFHAKHEDQQIRGLVRIVVGNIIASLLVKENYLISDSNFYCAHEKTPDELICFLLQILLDGIEDESFVCVKYSLQAVSLCLQPLLYCSKFKLVLPLLEKICDQVDNMYWLIKLKILDNVGDLPFELLYYAADSDSVYQEKIFKNVIIALLADQDCRVRSAAVQCLLKFINNSYYPIDHTFEPVAVTYAKRLNSVLKISHFGNKVESDDGSPISECNSSALERSLARTVYYMSQICVKTSSKYLIAGCCEVLSMLSTKYPPIKYPFSWQCAYIEKFTNYFPCELFNTALSLMTNTTLILNFDVHPYLLTLISRLFITLCDSNVKCNNMYSSSTNTRIWYFLEDSELSHLSELFLQHVIRLLNVFNDVVTNVPVKSFVFVQSSVYLVLPFPVDQPLLPQQELPLNNEKNFNLFKESKIHTEELTFVHYTRLPLFVKLSESLKSAYNNYKITLKPESSEKFVSFLKTLLECLSVILDYLSITEIDRFAKQLLSYLHNFMVFLPVNSVNCVVQLLKSVFGNNTIAEYLQFYEYGKNNLAKTKNFEGGGFYTECFQQSYDEIVNFMAANLKLNNLTKELGGTHYNVSILPFFKQSKRNICLNRLPSYIKLFEPNVIQSLRQYTVTSNTELQAEVLFLLTELIQLKVNYCLLDSEQVFIKFVLSQFQLIEEEQLLNLEKLLPRMFNFLINLANEKHSKPVMSVPKVIQLCDSLIASGQPVSQCVLAIDPVIRYVFLKSPLIANASEIKELETQRDVLFAMSLKLLNEVQSLRLLTLILNRSDEELKFKRSCQIVEIFFNALIDCKISINSDESYRDILQFLYALHPASYNEQHMLNVLFFIYHSNKFVDCVVWLPLFCAILLLIVSRYNEVVILQGIAQMLNHPVFSDDNDESDPLLVNVAASNAAVSSKKVFVKFLYKIIYSVLQYIYETKLFDLHQNSTCWKNKLFSELLTVICYIIKSGKYELVKSEFVNTDSDETKEKINFVLEITNLMNSMRTINPVITLKWYEFVSQLENEKFGLPQCFTHSNIINFSKPSNDIGRDNVQCLSSNVLKLGVFLLTCSFENELFSNTKTLKLFLENNFNEILNTFHESAVQNLLLHIQNSELSSRVLIEIIANSMNINESNDKLSKMLQCLEFTHSNTKIKIFFLCCRPKLFNSCLPIADRATALTVRSAEYLLTLQNIENELKYPDLLSLLQQLKQMKHCPLRLITLLSEVVAQFYGIQVQCTNDNRSFNIERIRSLVIDKEWFFNEVKCKCCSEEEVGGYVTSLLLSQLPLKDISTITESQKFNYKILYHCFSTSTELTFHKCIVGNINKKEIKFSDLYLATRDAIYRRIGNLQYLLPRTHQVYAAIKRKMNEKETQYSQQMDEKFSGSEFRDYVISLMPAVGEYLVSVRKLSAYVDLRLTPSAESYKYLADFSVLSAELIRWLVNNERYLPRRSVMSALKCCISILKQKKILERISVSQMGSIISSLCVLLESYTKESIKYMLEDAIQNMENVDETNLNTCHLASSLIDFFITKESVFLHGIAATIISYIRELLVILCQSPLLYNYVRIPLEIWKHVTKDDIIIVDSCVTLKNISENFLQDSDILRNFVSRLMFIGWNNRLQFEECWMSLLVSLNLLPEYESSVEEVAVLSQVNAISISAVTSLLVQTMYYPKPGYKISPTVLHVSRNTYSRTDQSRWKLKLAIVNKLLGLKMDDKCSCLCNNIDVNIEKLHSRNLYNFNQISVEYLLMRCEINSVSEDTPDSYHCHHLKSLYRETNNALQDIGIDTNSCIYFLMDFYSTWFLKPDGQPLQVLIEIINSMLVVSDLFTGLSQYSWLFESSILLWKKYSKDDVVVCSYLTVAICKSASMVTPMNSESRKLVVTILKSGLYHSESLIQNAAVCGLFYLIESIFKKDIIHKRDLIYSDYEEDILSAAILYVLENLDIDLPVRYSKENINGVISLGFYLVENDACGDNVDIIINRFCKLCVRVCKLKLSTVHDAIMQGFYNLVLNDNEVSKNHYTELSLLVKEILSAPECTTCVAISSLQLLTALMYCSDDFEDTRNDEAQFDSEKLMLRIEKISVYFDRIKKGCKTEVKMICAILPQILNDFFPASEILNKMISEFLSPQQPYPELMAEVVFKVFQNGIQQFQLTLIQDWVLSLLNNFSQFSLPKAIFYLTCFFISACTNTWLTAFFPSITQKNELEYEDRKIFHVSAAEFYSQLQNESQKNAFITTFQSAEQIHPSSPFSDVLRTVL